MISKNLVLSWSIKCNYSKIKINKIKQLISAGKTSREYQWPKQRPESPTVAFTWHASVKYMILKLHQRYIFKKEREREREREQKWHAIDKLRKATSSRFGLWIPRALPTFTAIFSRKKGTIGPWLDPFGTSVTCSSSMLLYVHRDHIKDC